MLLANWEKRGLNRVSNAPLIRGSTSLMEFLFFFQKEKKALASKGKLKACEREWKSLLKRGLGSLIEIAAKRYPKLKCSL